MILELVFSAARLAFARRRRGMTKTHLAREAKLNPRTLVAYEAGASAPDKDILQRIATALKFPVEFFYGDELDELNGEGVSFRSMTKRTASQRSMALGAGSVALILNEWIERHFKLPDCGVPNLSGEATPEAASEWVRNEWQLGDAPIKNIVHLLESKGVRVYSLAMDANEVDAFSFWRNDTPFVFLNTRKSAERSRFDAAHELGHLVMHRHAAPRGLDAETQANSFASAFLMPEKSIRAHSTHLATVAQLIQLKKVWTVSVMALSYRLHALKIISDWHYHTLCKQMSARGFRRAEPEGARRETSQVLAKVFAALRDEGRSKADIAQDLNLMPQELEELVFGLTLTAVSAAPPGEEGGRNISRQMPLPPLRMVK